MNSHVTRRWMAVPSASVSRIGGRPTSHAAPRESSALGFVGAVALVTTAMVTGAALLTLVPLTVTVPLATVLGAGLVASVVAATVGQWLALRQRRTNGRRT